MSEFFFYNIKVKTGKGSSFLESSKIQAEYSRSVKNFILVIIDDPYQLLIHVRERGRIVYANPSWGWDECFFLFCAKRGVS